ncbi:MAG TPA: PDZ domain-containing protein [Planctomycetota bacterium]|nr:PDZ domain-containing protein [Planctomycetota bacterium]
MKLAKTLLGLAPLCAPIALLPFETPSAGPQGSPAQEKGPEGIVATWIEELGAPDHEVRGRAWESLLDRGTEVLRDLDKAAREAKDPEIRWNARLLAREIRRQEKPRRNPDRTLPALPAPPRGIDRDGPLRQEFDELRRRMGDFDDLHRQMEDLHRRLEEEFRNAPPGSVDRRGNSVRVETGADGSVHVEVTETRDGERETKTYDAQSWEEFRQNYPEVAEKYGLGGGGVFRFHLAPGGGDSPWWNGAPFFSTPAPLAGSFAGPRLGVHVEEPGEEDSKAAGAEEGVGLVVRHVEPGSLAEAMKILPGDLLLQIDGKPIHGTETIRRAVGAAKEGSAVSVLAFRPGEGKLTLSAIAPKVRTTRAREL